VEVRATPRVPPVARVAVAALAALALLALLWETVLAPLRPGSAWLALKALPLLVLLPGVARGRLRARQIASLLLPWYVAEGLVRALTEHGRHALVAALSALLALCAFAAILAWLRGERKAVT
jgi:uncharacterized membrane protein